MAKFHRKEVVEAISFDELVAHGVEQCKAEARGSNIVNGVPWSFNYGAYAVTHENDDLYIVGPFNFSRGNMLVTEGGSVRIVAGSTFAQKYEPAHLSLRAVPQDVAEPMELVGYQFRYVFHDQDNRRSDWSSVLPPPRRMQNGTQTLKSDTHHFEVRDVFGGPVGGGAPVLATPPDREALLLAKDALTDAVQWLEGWAEIGSAKSNYDKAVAALAAINAALDAK